MIHLDVRLVCNECRISTPVGFMVRARLVNVDIVGRATAELPAAGRRAQHETKRNCLSHLRRTKKVSSGVVLRDRRAGPSILASGVNQPAVPSESRPCPFGYRHLRCERQSGPHRRLPT